MAELKDGMIEFAIEVGPAANPRGHVMFGEMVKHFGSQAKGIVGYWSHGDNLAKFNTLTAQGMSLKQAAAATWTNQQAASHGFPVVKTIQS